MTFTKVLFALLAPLFLILAACDKALDARTQPSARNWNLPVMKTPALSIPFEYTAVGSVVSDRRIDVSSRMSGHIREILVSEGDRVLRGQVLARIDAADVDGAIRQGRAAVGAADAVFRDAQIDLDRFQRLYERGSVSENELRKIRLKHDATRESLNQARAVLDTALAQRAYVEITSPEEGVVVARLKRAGDLAVPGVLLLTIESGHNLLFETFVSEGRVSAISPGNPVRVKIDALAEALNGTVVRVVPSGDPVTRSYQVKIALPETVGLMPGMFGRTRFTLGENKSPVIPSRALVERGGLRGVFVVDGEDRARFRWLRTGREWRDRIEVTAGLQAGERLVVAVDPALRDGDRITGPEIAHE